MSTTAQPDLFSSAFLTDPYPVYARLQKEAPVYRTALPDGTPIWLVTRYDDIVAALKDKRFRRNIQNVLSPEQLAALPPQPEAARLYYQNMFFSDPPQHTRLRALVQKAFTTSLVERQRERVQQITDQLISAVASRGEMDLIEDFAFPLPIMVICELYGIPLEDQHRIRAWSDAIAAADLMTAEKLGQIAPHIQSFAGYILELCEARRKTPGGDLISALVQAQEQGDKLSQEELLSMIILLVVAGHGTTVNLISNSMLSLFRNPDQLALLQRDPSLIKKAVEEFLRYESPSGMLIPLYASEDLELSGVRIAKGEAVIAALGAAGRDSAHCKPADKLDITREDIQHLTFGHGMHYCVGAPLARLEGDIAITSLLRRLPDIRLAVPFESLAWRPNLMIRGVVSMPVRFSPTK